MLVGPIVVGAAGERRRPSGRRRSRRHDTGDLEAVPAEIPGAVQTDVDPEAVRYAPRAPRRFIWLRRLAVLLVVAVLVWVGSSAAYTWSQRQYYVAPASGKVAIYKGVEADVPTLELHRVYQVSETSLSDLPDYNKSQVSGGMTTRNLKAARALVRPAGPGGRLRARGSAAGAHPHPDRHRQPHAQAVGQAFRKDRRPPGRPPRRPAPAQDPAPAPAPGPTGTASSGTGSTSDNDCTDGG